MLRKLKGIYYLWAVFHMFLLLLSPSGKKAITEYTTINRTGDHQWYISDVGKFRKHYSKWNITYTIDDIIMDICRSVDSK